MKCRVSNAKLFSPIKYMGSKSRMLDIIIENFPKEYEAYIEGFGGGASILLRKQPTPVEIYNDLGQNVYSLFKVLQDKNMFEELKNKMDLTYYSIQICKEGKEQLKRNDLSIVDLAYWFIVSNRMSFNGVGSFCTNLLVRRSMSKCVSDFLSMIDKLPHIHNRLSSCIIENRNFFDLIDKYDHPRNFFYLDPPYVAETRTSKSKYEHEFSDEDHEKFVDRCLNSHSMILISGYDHPIYKKLDEKFIKIQFQSPNTNSDRTETLWRNYEI